LSVRVEAGAVEFDVPRGRTLRGHCFAAGETWAVLVHDEGRDLDGWRNLAAGLTGQGISVLVFDLPGHGASDDPWEPELAEAAVVAAIDFVRSQAARQVHLVAAGAGAIASLAAAAGAAPDVASAALLTPRLDDRVAALDKVREARLPKLIMVGSLDPDAVRDAEAVFRVAIGRCEMARIPVMAQGADMLWGDWGQQASEKVLAHLRRWRR
jgi:alpha-beta hydrolase superfamily lysophospholipase